ncbi:unnamed protein product [Prorocentrum cordatum]|uniref:PDZ domain-containing protein n=1 Tax=Prorocentrum cordatum TaxID=2364126 RepID=A0ABN9UKE2_9DINO|nr:unnamed protein product [Polarella glacialis]
MPTFLELGIRRPRKAKAQPEALTDTKPPSLLGTDAQVPRVLQVDLDPLVAYTMVDQNFNTPTASDMTVSKISPGSPIDVFNKANPTNQVHVGDTVTAVNGAVWSGNSMQFPKMHKMVELSHKAGKPEKGEPSVLPLKLCLQRRQ